MSKKIAIFIIALSLLSQFGFNTPKSYAVNYNFAEDFSTVNFKNSVSTTADWNTTEKKITLNPYYIVSDWSSYFSSFTAPVTAIANNNYIQMIGGQKALLNSIPSGAFSSFQTLSSQLVNFGSVDINAVAQSIPSGYAYWLVGGGVDNGSGGGTGPKLNKLEVNGYSTQTGTLWKVTDLSPDLVSLKFNSVSDIACNNNECLIIGTPALGTATARLVKYNGTNFTDLSANIDFNTTYRDKIAWNGSYWLIGGTRYYPPESSSYIGKIYKYDGANFTKITDDSMFAGQGPSIFDMAWNGNYWLVGRGYSPVKLYKYNGNSFTDLSAQINKFSFINEIATPTIFWTGKAWLIGGGNYFKHLIRFDGTNMTDIINSLINFSDSGVGVIESKYSTAYNDFLIGGGIGGPKLNSAQELGYKTSGVVQSKKINTTTEIIAEATLTATDQRPQTTSGAGVSISYYLSANGGANWEQVTPNTKHIFTNAGNDLQWRAILSTTDSSVTPVINSVNINYSSQTLTSLTTIISPNGGETWKIGETHIITWSHASEIVGKNVQLSIHLLGPDSYLIGSAALPGKDLLLYGPTNTIINSVLGGEFSWTIPASLTAGSYKIEIEEYDSATGSNHIDSSDAPFNITTASTQPSITVTSPNGGEQWAIGSTQTIRWNSAGSISQVTISLIPTDPSVGTRTLGTVANSGLYSWTIPNCSSGNECSSNFQIPTGSYKVQISSSGVSDISDATFSVVSAGTTLPYPNGTLVKTSSSDKIYLIENSQKRWITSPEALIAYGLQPNSQIVISQTDLDKYLAGSDITKSVTNIPEGGLIRVIGDTDVWIVKYVGTKKFKRLILSPNVFNSYGHLKWGDIKDIDKSTVDSFTISDLVRAVNDVEVYKLYPSGDTGQKRWITTADSFTRMSFDWDSIYQINQVDRDSYNTGQTIE